jgi:SIR2-like domain
MERGDTVASTGSTHLPPDKPQSSARAPVALAVRVNAGIVVRQMLLNNKVVPLLGAGVNLCGRPVNATFERGRYLPNGRELAEVLADFVRGFPPTVLEDLIRVSQCVDRKVGWQALYQALHDVFDDDYPPTAVHDFFARMPSLVRKLPKATRAPYQLIITTNYDDTLERAFVEAGEEYDLVWYAARGEHPGRFFHRAPNGSTEMIEEAGPDGEPSEQIRGVSLEERPVILKVHGAVDRRHDGAGEDDSYVITEDDYIDYLSRNDVTKLLPTTIAGKLRTSNILFLGYSMSDWNLRAIFRRIWEEEKHGWTSWAVRQPLELLTAEEEADEDKRTAYGFRVLERSLEEDFWKDRNVDIVDVDLADYVATLEDEAETVLAGAGAR